MHAVATEYAGVRSQRVPTDHDQDVFRPLDDRHQAHRVVAKRKLRGGATGLNQVA
jgi:hypothetical protein